MERIIAWEVTELLLAHYWERTFFQISILGPAPLTIAAMDVIFLAFEKTFRHCPNSLSTKTRALWDKGKTFRVDQRISHKQRVPSTYKWKAGFQLKPSTEWSLAGLCFEPLLFLIVISDFSDAMISLVSLFSVNTKLFAYISYQHCDLTNNLVKLEE